MSTPDPTSQQTRARAPRPIVLMILDGFGERPERADNAVRLAVTPSLDALYARYPHGLIGTSGPDVGLPPGQMGNSEVGHLNFGAGRIAQMDISRIDNAVHDGSLGRNAVLGALLDEAANAGTGGAGGAGNATATTGKGPEKGRVHLLGLVSDGGVHSSLTHLLALIDMIHARGLTAVVHAFLDGRDVQPKTAPKYLAAVEEKLGAGGARRGIIGTVSGRYWAMDRDNRWERVERAFRAIVEGTGARHATADAGVRASIDAGKTDEFVEPFVVGDYAGVRPGDVALHFNFRPDRARELSRALAVPSFDAFARPEVAGVCKAGGAPFASPRYACMTTYDASLGLPVAFPKETYPDIFPEVIAARGLTQFRCAETEKYAHVTYFFNGGREEPFAGETRKMIPSPKEVATYDQKPEMSAAGVADAVVEAIESDKYDFVLVNFANPDMVGHTGVLGAAVTAVQAVDVGIGRIAAAVQKKHGALFVTADHGNCELMKDPATGEPHTAHTLNPVPLLYVNDADRGVTIREHGRICDVAPTILELLGIEKPAAMTGESLFSRA